MSRATSDASAMPGNASGADAPAARAVDLSKTYGVGQAIVKALDVVSRVQSRRVHRGDGAVRLGQVDADALLRRARHRHVGARSSSATPRSDAAQDKALTRLRRDQIGFVFQSYNLVPTLTAEENIRCRWRSPAASPTRTGTTR